MTPQAHQLWESMVRAHTSANPEFGETRALLMLGTRTPSTWTQYANALKAFMEFAVSRTPPLSLDRVTASHLADFVCWVAEGNRSLSGDSLAQYLSGVKTCLRELGISFNDEHATKQLATVLAGYKRAHREASAPVVKRPPWLAAYTTQAFDLLGSTADSASPQHRHLLVSVMHVALASICMQRGDSTNSVIMRDFEPTRSHTGQHGFRILFRKQKRPGKTVPEQLHYASASHHDPVQHLLQWYASIRASRGPHDLLFGLSSSSKTAFTLDESVKCLAATLSLKSPSSVPFTGHCPRIGAITEAFLIGVPIESCAHLACHAKASTTEQYIRHGTAPSHQAQVFYGHMVPGARQGDTLPF